jgi:general secretion pathway protein C
VDRAEVDNALSNLSKVATQARIVPSFRNGKPNGFKLFSIKPGSIYSKIGLKNGDVIQKINGYEMNSPDKALEIYQKLKDASSVSIEFQRRGKSKHFNYNIQ